MAAAMLTNAAPAQAGVDDIQIDWIISEQEWATVVPKISGRDVEFDFRLVPSKLYQSEEEIVAEDGKKLLPAGTQLYAMTGRNLTVCSQLAAQAPYVGAANRVCLHDDDGDGTLDSYWLRFPLQQMFGKADWFALNGELPAQRSRIVHPKLRLAPLDAAEKPAELSLRISLRRNGNATGTIWVKNGNAFYGNCRSAVNTAEHVSRSFCLIPDLVVRAEKFDSKNKNETSFEIVRPKRNVNVRFQISKGLFGFSVESIYLE